MKRNFHVKITMENMFPVKMYLRKTAARLKSGDQTGTCRAAVVGGHFTGIIVAQGKVQRIFGAQHPGRRPTPARLKLVST